MGPAVACSPPTSVARSPALPIARGAARLVPCARISNDGGAVTAERRSEDGASPLLRPSARFSFSSKSCTPASRSQSAASASAAAGGSLRSRPPAGPSAVKAQNVLIGFDAPSETHAPPKGAPPSPGRRETSLLSIALSDLPPGSSGGGAAAAAGSAFSPALDLFGTTSPSGGFLRRQDSSEPDFAQLDALAGQHPVMASPVVRAAYAAASRAHAGQLRKSGEPVISHCLATAAILAELGLPEETVAAGLLHDVLSDTRVTAWQLEEHVPRSCVELVEKVTRLSEVSQLYRDNAHSLEAASILHMLTSMSDVSALLVKLADRLHNMRTVGALSRCKQVRMASETLDVFAVLANRLGAWSVKAELEDLAFKTLQPEDYEQVFRAVAERAALIDLPARVAQVRAALAAAGLDVVDVSGRVKNIYGVWRKLQAGGLGVDRIDEVYDVAALRVVVPHKHDCYRALREVEGLWAAVPGRFKDYVRNRKGNGYQSLHTTVFTGAADAGAGAAPAIQGADDPATAAAAGLPVPSLLEVQIRTPKMHYIAEYGFAAHWRYKEKLSREDLWLDRLVQWKKWVAAEKLRLRDSKVREGGSPQRDPVLAALIESLAAASPDA
ncbi:GTP pyrophosphokinase, partial [Monoraphidium neglectum]